MLLSLPEHQQRQLLEGDWDIKEGAAFTEFDRDTHVIEPFDIPRNWVKFRSCDYGYGSYSAVLWFAVSPDEQIVVYRELYVSKVLATDLADMILELEENDGTIKSVLTNNHRIMKIVDKEIVSIITKKKRRIILFKIRRNRT